MRHFLPVIAAVFALLTGMALAGATTPAPGEGRTIVITDHTIDAPVVQLPAGSTAHFANLSGTPHQIVVRSDDGESLTVSHIEPGEIVAITFHEPGRYQWASSNVPAVQGEILVGAVRSPGEPADGSPVTATTPGPVDDAADATPTPEDESGATPAPGETPPPPEAGNLGIAPGTGGPGAALPLFALSMILFAAASLMYSVVRGTLSLEPGRRPPGH